MSAQWSDEAEALVLHILERYAYDGGIPGANFNSNDASRATDDVLEALVEAGLLIEPSGAPRTWSLPPEPGPEVTAVHDPGDRRLWLRWETGSPSPDVPGEHWWYPEDGDPHEDGADWDELVAAAWPDGLTDATSTPPPTAAAGRDPEAGGAVHPAAPPP